MPVFRRLRFHVCALLLVPGSATTPVGLAAQTAITIEGRVVDGNGAPVADAQVTAIERATGERRHALTRPTGEFRILALSPGSYTVTVSATGFHSGDQVAELVVGQRPRLTFELRPSAFELEPIVVPTASVAATEIRRTSVSAPVLEQEIRHLPLSTRSVMDLAALAPGIRSYRVLGGHSLPQAGALRGERFINLYIDGVELKSLYDGNLVGFPQAGSPLPADALKEFRVYLNPYDAAYARAAAYVISAVTHRGTNETTASVFGFLQHRDLVAANDFLQAVPNFAGADFERQQVGVNLRGPIIRNRLFYAATYELSNGRSFMAVVPGRPAFDPAVWDAHAGVFEMPSRNHMGLLRLTYAPDDAHTVDVIGSIRQLTNEWMFGRDVSYESRVAEEHAVNTLNLRHRWHVTPQLANELSFQVVSWSHAGRARVPGPAFSYPNLKIGAPGGRFDIDENHFRLINRLTRAWQGRHVTSTGVEIARVGIDHFFPIGAEGFFDFNSDTATLPRFARISVGSIFPDSDRDALAAAAGWSAGLYASHEWQPIPQLTLNIGLRYDADINLLNNHFTVPWAADPELGERAELQRYLNRGDRRNDLDNISPRASFSWDLFNDSRMFLRGGFGIIYDRVPSFIPFQERRDATWRTYVFGAPGTTDPDVLRQRVASGEGRLASFTLVANDMDTPVSRQWSVGLGRRITPALAFNLDYVHQDVRNLFAKMNLNWLDASAGAPRRALSSSYGDIYVWDDFARARYRALLGQLTFQPNADTRLNLAYTLGNAKADWDGETRNVPAVAAGQFYVMQRTSGDERHRFVMSGLAPLPFQTTGSLIATAASPRPYQAWVGEDLNRNEFLFDDWIDGKRFLVPANAWRNWYRVVDVRLARGISLPRGTRGSVTAEAFNIFNTVNYSSFQGIQTTPTGNARLDFQQPNAVFGTRQFQIGTRIEF